MICGVNLANEAFYLVSMHDQDSRVPLSVSDAEKVLAARSFLVSCSRLEDLFSLIAISYKEFETFVFEAGLAVHIGEFDGLEEGLDEKFLRSTDYANQKLLGLTNSHRALVDQYPQRLRSSYTHSVDLVELFKKFLASAFDNSFEYRIFDLLRNVTIHSQLPTKPNYSVSTLAETFEDFPNGRVVGRSSLELNISKETLTKAQQGRRKTKDEIDAISENELDLKVVVRGFISALFDCRSSFHSEIQAYQNDQVSCYNDALALFKAQFPSHNQLVILSKTIDGKEADQVYLKEKFPTLVASKQKRYFGLRAALTRYPSIEVSDRKDVYQGNFPKLWKR